MTTRPTTTRLTMMRLTTIRPVLARAALAALGASTALLLAAACFSERDGATGPAPDGECTVPASAAGATVVFIRDFAFVTSQVRVRPGERVVWVNCESSDVSHTSTSDGAGWDSGLLAPGDFYERAFPQAGSFPYHCEPHPGMTGTVIVE
jgi:plastocyanin